MMCIKTSTDRVFLQKPDCQLFISMFDLRISLSWHLHHFLDFFFRQVMHAN